MSASIFISATCCPILILFFIRRLGNEKKIPNAKEFGSTPESFKFRTISGTTSFEASPRAWKNFQIKKQNKITRFGCAYLIM